MQIPALTDLLLSPWMLVTLFALLIPIVIHLITKSRGKLVPIPYLALIQQVKQQPSYHIQLIERLLLLIRLLLLLVAGLILAELVGPQVTSSNEEVVLVSRDWLDHATPDNRSDMASQLQGNRNHTRAWLLDDLSQSLTAQAILAWTDRDTDNEPYNTWAKITQFSAQLPSNQPIKVYTTNRAAYFRGQKSRIEQPLDWQTMNLPMPLEAKWSVTSKATILFSERYRDSVDFVDAGLNALNAEAPISLSVARYPIEQLPPPSAQSDVIFWLADEPIPEPIMAQVKGGSTLIRHGSTARTLAQDWVQSRSFYGSGQIIILAGVFHPDVLPVVGEAGFALHLAELVFSSQIEQFQLKNGRLSEAQITHLPEVAGTKQDSATHLPASPINLTWLLVILFCLERLLSEKVRLGLSSDKQDNVQ